ncbi:MAG TPA: sigma-70 family RNA polymerase sigma factor [Bryobacteraceae bacterium]|nr:sigma-70 family RNA polymerase sigma factor [Bryobacteraceae bacterium]
MDKASRARDAWIALRCQSGEADAFEDLIAVMERPLLYYAAKLLGNEEFALDALQDVWMRVVRGIRRLQDPASLRPWLYRITYGMAIDRIRHDSSRQHAEELHIEGVEEADEPDFENADAAAVHAALDAIDLRHREVLVLHFLEDFSVAEIAAVIGCPEGTVKSRIHHAKKAMKQILSRGGYGK